ncbi:hypothetical protein Nepgr_003336 [Nepenthes gracilis]|uniref:FCP1 homology domain-containing protein n=1 Tax=Nepenthes gracilis TaxID=150966 RepID=A0AAD3XDF6_NEPGR|nr:hypothetical protein Nepgr_003336 [Nepenthes gracilis]
MQTKKKVSSRTFSRDPISLRIPRSQKKLSENAQVVENRAGELITSSARKSRFGGTLTRINGDSTATNFSSRCSFDKDETSNASLGSDVDTSGCMILEEHNGGTTHYESDTIFSPSFHLSKNGGETGNGGTNGTCLSPEVSAIYLAMKNSKLECLDEHGHDSMPDEASMEEDEYEEFDDFDPYLFMKNLPDLSTVVPTFRPLLLPKQTRRCPRTTLVLDLDETLVHSTLEPCNAADFTFAVNFNQKEHTVYVRCRPYLRDFMERVASLFEIIIFTASQSIYAEQLLNVLDPRRRIFRHRVYRESCVYVEGNYLKDLSILGRDLARVIIIDNSPQAFGFQVDNGIPIESWFDDRTDEELLLLLPFLESLVGVEDVRPLISEKFNLRKKIAAAVYPPLNSNRGDAFER